MLFWQISAWCHTIGERLKAHHMSPEVVGINTTFFFLNDWFLSFLSSLCLAGFRKMPLALIIIKMPNILGYFMHNKQTEDTEISLWKSFLKPIRSAPNEKKKKKKSNVEIFLPDSDYSLEFCVSRLAYFCCCCELTKFLYITAMWFAWDNFSNILLKVS